MNTGFLAVGSFASSLLGMLLIPFYTSILSTADYGVSDLIVTTTSLLFPFLSVAISESIMRFALDKDNDKATIYSAGLYTVGIGLIILVCFSPVIKLTPLGPYLIYFLLYFLCFCLHTITSYFVKGIEKLKLYSVAGFLNSCIVILCNILFLLVFKIGIVGYLLSLILGHGITVIFLFFGAKLYRYITIPWKLDVSLYRKMLMYSIPIIPNSISWWISNSSDKYVLQYFSDLSEVGIYSVSYKIPTVVMTVMGLFISAWQISSIESFGTDESKKFFSNVYKHCFAINIILSSFLICTSKLFGSFLYAKDFSLAWRYVPVLVLANTFNVLASFLGSVYTVAKKTKMLSVSTVISALSNIVMNFALIPFIGAMGAAVATLAAYMIMWIIRLINTRKIMKFPIDHKLSIMLLGLLGVQIVLAEIDSTVTWVLAAAIFLVLLFVYRSTAASMVKTVLSKFIKPKNKIDICLKEYLND